MPEKKQEGNLGEIGGKKNGEKSEEEGWIKEYPWKFQSKKNEIKQ